MTTQQYLGTGRRKTSIARVFLTAGKGKILVRTRGKEVNIDQYFDRQDHVNNALAPINVAKLHDKLNIIITVKGGGITGQAGAIRLGLSRALLSYDEGLHKDLKKEGFLTRDARKVERKKYGKRKARKSVQFSKR